MEIQTIAILGLGALGTMYADHLTPRLPRGNVRVVAGRDRITRYQKDGVFVNDRLSDFFYLPGDSRELPPADLVLVAVKAPQLAQALEQVRFQVGENTILISVLNGIDSEDMLGEIYGMDKVLYCMVYGMDATKKENRLWFQSCGKLCLGDRGDPKSAEQLAAVSRFFDRTGLAYELPQDIHQRMWSKFMFNVGCNQISAVYGANYGRMSAPGEARDTLLAAMQEVRQVAAPEGITLTEADMEAWMKVMNGINPAGKTSMLQDIEAGRSTELELFAGTVRRLGKKHGIATPVNNRLYEQIRLLEKKD